MYRSIAFKNMKKIAVFAVTAMMMAACGGSGGSGSSGGKSGLKTNAVLGRSPAIHADYLTAQEALKKEREALYHEVEALKKELGINRLSDEIINALDSKARGKFEKLMERSEKLDEKDSKMDSELEAALNAEVAKLAGKPVPFTVSEAFKKLNIEVLEVRMCDGSIGFEALIAAKVDFELNRDNRSAYEYTCYREVAKDGSTISTSHISHRLSNKYAKGQPIAVKDERYKCNSFHLYHHPQHYADFASIEFIDSEELVKYQKEARIILW